MVKTDIDTPDIQQTSICPELHPKLQYLNEIQLQFRGKVGEVYTDKYLEETFPDLHSSPKAPVCPSRPAVPPPGVPDSPPGVPDRPARLPSAPVAPQALRPQISGLSPDCGPGPVRPQAPAHGPRSRPRPRPGPLAPAPGPWQAPAPGTGPSQGKPRITGPPTLVFRHPSIWNPRHPETLAALRPPAVTPRPARPPAGTPRLASHGISLLHSGTQGEPGPTGYSPPVATPRPPQDNSPFHYRPQARRPDRAIGPARPTTSSHIQHRGLAAWPMAGRSLQSWSGQTPGQAPKPGPALHPLANSTLGPEPGNGLGLGHCPVPSRLPLLPSSLHIHTQGHRTCKK
jgi:hypothetical protein